MNNISCKKKTHKSIEFKYTERIASKNENRRHLLPEMIIQFTGVHQLAIFIICDIGELLGEDRYERSEYLKGRCSHPFGVVVQMLS